MVRERRIELLTDRDYEILDLIQRWQCLTIADIHERFFHGASYRRAADRLVILAHMAGGR